MKIRTLRLTLGAVLLLGAAPLATASQARCVPTYAVVCSTLNTACHTVDDLGVVHVNCPVY